MGSGYGNEYRPGPCDNCEKPGGGGMSSSEWGHDGLVCSHACGTRLDKKIENGMIDGQQFERNSLFGGSGSGSTAKEASLRLRVKQLEAKVKALSR